MIDHHNEQDAARLAAMADPDEIEAALDRKDDYYEGIIHAVIDAIGGEVEGAPTSRVNFLQRCRALRKEAERCQKALDAREQQYIKLLQTGDKILDGVRKLLSRAGFASEGSD